MLTRRRFAGLVAASALTSLASSGLAQAWPTRHVRLIVPFVPGGAADVIARVMANRLAEAWGQQVVVENRGGAGSNIGAQAAAQSDPDGYTLYITSVPHATNRFLYASLNYDPVADFAPITLICTQSNIMVVPNSSPAKSVLEFIAHAKANAGKTSYGSGGIGTSVHLSGELFKRMAGIEMTHVPYRGAAPALQDVIAGRLDVIFDNITAGLPQVKNGAARGLAVTAASRVPVAAQLPTIAEAGVSGFDVSTWFALFAPAKTPRDIIGRINADAAAALTHPMVKARLEQFGATLVGSSPAELAAFLKAEMDKWGPLIREAKIKVDE
ncbi:MAG TPA: tripartite tricarboxylate transporter substrate binding protein [Xanthobacteraceae bacterium]|jgi:tripartite-type tricarboxylate transporter receptor subunit TctC|nr:tripartite tricarboxylate transporter substrate binding protein [Xanthobacteraceae bacterium]